MMHRALPILLRRTCAALVLFAGARVAAAQVIRLGGDDYVQRRYATREGLPQGTITGIAQSPDGFLWASTLGGLARFDGERFRVFNAASTPALTTDWLIIRRDGARDLTVVPIGGGRSTRLAGGRLTPLPAGTDIKDIRTTLTDSGDVIWVASPIGLYRVHDGKARRYTTSDGLAAGMDPNGEPLHGAAIQGHAGIARLLLAAGASANRPSADGSTPLRDAALWGRMDVAQLLLDAGADPSVAGVDGWSATDVARERGHTELLILLQSHTPPPAR